MAWELAPELGKGSGVSRKSVEAPTGEDVFHIGRRVSGEVRFDITAFSRPADVVVRLGSPIARLVQQRVTRGYLEGVRRYAAMARG